jgi:hypothetical protein
MAEKVHKSRTKNKGIRIGDWVEARAIVRREDPRTARRRITGEVVSLRRDALDIEEIDRYSSGVLEWTVPYRNVITVNSKSYNARGPLVSALAMVFSPVLWFVSTVISFVFGVLTLPQQVFEVLGFKSRDTRRS